MNAFLEKLSHVFRDQNLRKRIFFVIASLVLFRLLTTIPIPGIDAAKLSSLFANSQFLGLLNIFSGGGLSNLSIVMLGVGPYITATIIMQLLTLMVPSLKALYQEEGEAGRVKFAQYSRRLSLPLALVQGFSFIIIFQRQGIIPDLSAFQLIVNVFTIAAGSTLLMWLGELITEFGFGNGTSIIIFAGIIARIPQSFSGTIASYDPSQLPVYAAIVALSLAVIYAVVVMTEAERPVPITYAKQVRGNKVYGGVSTYLPIRLNQAGVIPIIFALSILLFPQLAFNLMSASTSVFWKGIAAAGLAFMNNAWLYDSFYFLLVFVFTYFYTAVTFDPLMISENLQKSGAFIPGVRPGQSTAEYLSKIVTRITLVGAIFLGIVAVLPLALRSVSGITTLAIGGTALLIVVSVVLDIVKHLDAQVSMREY
ncbi:MAG: preprotein translocase subunit SecY [Patescibacteria group bacterium]|nr:preprotein translocase subunit SecY [Patescibacteria group bacterium]MDE2116682.1 preprotein translocase subunit SecY [Patescibacteria group bacterium]